MLQLTASSRNPQVVTVLCCIENSINLARSGSFPQYKLKRSCRLWICENGCSSTLGKTFMVESKIKIRLHIVFVRTVLLLEADTLKVDWKVESMLKSFDA